MRFKLKNSFTFLIILWLVFTINLTFNLHKINKEKINFLDKTGPNKVFKIKMKI